MIRAQAQLIEAARSGDSAAVVQLLNVCQPDPKRFARRACTTSEDAEDAVQAASWHLYRRIGALRTAASFATWMFRIVERECYRLFRRQPVTAALDNPASLRALTHEVPHDLRLDLSRAIAALPAPYSDVLILRDVDELTAPEVAAQMG